MAQENQISTNDLALMIKKGFDGMTTKINSVAKQIRKVQKGLDDLTVICKQGFDGTPSLFSALLRCVFLEFPPGRGRL